jgi:hypothetical protein
VCASDLQSVIRVVYTSDQSIESPIQTPPVVSIHMNIYIYICMYALVAFASTKNISCHPVLNRSSRGEEPASKHLTA